jgi:predicted permease
MPMQTMLRWLEQFGRDLAHAWRSLRRSPTFAVVVVATIAIGIGANATVLGIMDVAFLRKLPVPDADRIVRVLCGDTSRSVRWAKAGASSCSFPEARDLSQSVQGINGLAAYTMSYVKLGGEYSGIEPYGSFVSGNYFDVLGVRPQRGRYIAPDDADPTQPRAVVVISDVLWRGTFGADENAVGRRIVIGSSEFTVIGIAPKDWSGVHPEGRTDFWLPYTTLLMATGKDVYESRDARVIWPRLVGRLSAGASLGQVQGSLDNAALALALRYPGSNAAIRYRATLSSTLVAGPDAMNALSGFLVALIVVALVHLVACSNVASLMLGRAAARRRELGIRLCLGASRSRIFVSTLAEPLLLGALGGVGGLFVSRWFTDLVTSMRFMSAMNPGLDMRVITLVAIVSAGTALLFGLAPALLSARRDPMEVLRSASATSASSLGSPASILVLQAALSLVLLAQSQLLDVSREYPPAISLGSVSCCTRASICTSARWS